MDATTALERDPPQIRVAILNDYEVVVRGLAAILAPFAGRVEIVELDCGVLVSQPVHVALYDAYAAAAGDNTDLDLLAGDPMVQHTVLYTWAITPEVVRLATDRRLSGVLSKHLDGPQLVDALERICAGESVISTGVDDDKDHHPGDWPGREQGLTGRQSEMIVLITAGLSNQQIADRCYLSLNSVKSYIRAAYRTMGVDSRTKAVLWGIEHGFRPGTPSRLLPLDDDRQVFQGAPTPE